MPTSTAAEKHPITPPTMRRMHSGFHDHGLSTDEGVHAYLSALLGRDIVSRKDLTEAEGRKAVDDLAEAPHAATPALLRKLRAPFPDEAVGKLPRSTCRDCSQSQRKRCDRHQWVSNCPECHNGHSSATMHIDYVGHGDVTQRLLEVDPLWSWEPMSRDQFGNPAYDRDGNLWINLTVLGITRPGVGDAGNGKGAKERVGDALRNAAMRFGVALDLWVKGDREWKAATTDDINPSHDFDANSGDPAATYDGPTAQQLLDRISELAISQGTDPESMTAKWRERHGGITYDAMCALEARFIRPFVQELEAYIANHPTREDQSA